MLYPVLVSGRACISAPRACSPSQETSDPAYLCQTQQAQYWERKSEEWIETKKAESNEKDPLRTAY